MEPNTSTFPVLTLQAQQDMLRQSSLRDYSTGQAKGSGLGKRSNSILAPRRPLMDYASSYAPSQDGYSATGNSVYEDKPPQLAETAAHSSHKEESAESESEGLESSDDEDGSATVTQKREKKSLEELGVDVARNPSFPRLATRSPSAAFASSTRQMYWRPSRCFV